ncbi:polysaccharide deacetylase family sporulation protein PdaB [Seinonella peptonophila]|uniref:Polysaccharide deacetylase family sporulation protein PdaB n=1 Tax=Seinonella peptonophila TaxID=112248 RepID=A0A1M4X4E0_9BACL|nr:polysaccharide deacetylase family protein [Seinonella peptonophila]SHE88325.1 polysaccharide deacetylase family sporulation protein PdaB [Seinonella peptonophila]
MTYRYGMVVMLCLTLVIAGCWDHSFADQFLDDPKGRKYYEQRGEIIWEKPMKKKWIALTFDDGPHPMVTSEILSILKQYHAKATFFCMGAKVKLRPHIVKRMISEGHEIGNHTYHHKKLQRLSSQSIQKEMDLSQQITMKTTGRRPVLFRPPEGYYNADIIKLAKKNRQQVILWSWDQDTKDWRNPSVSFIVNKVTKNASNGDIVLFHDTQMVTVRALKRIIPILKKEGYQFVTVSQLIQGVTGKSVTH